MTTLVVERTETVTIADALARMADLLEEFGWCQGRLGSRAEGEMCLIGALSEASGDFGRYVWRGLGPALERVGIPTRPEGSSVTSDWNDAPGRTKAEVVARLREAARLVKEAE